MTTSWKPARHMWAGQTVAVLASGPSMSPPVARGLRMHRTIAVKHTYRLAPWADMLVALDHIDPVLPDGSRFAGMHVCAHPGDHEGLCIGPMYEHVTLGPGHQVHLHNSGLAAIRIAAAMGAARILLAGFDPETPGRFEGHPAAGEQNLQLLAAGLDMVVRELRGRGIVLDRLRMPQRRAAHV